jgi:hypothetical protein
VGRNLITSVRVALALAVGAFYDLTVFLDAYPYNQRSQHELYNSGSSGLLIAMLIPLVCAFLLDFKVLRPRDDARSTRNSVGVLASLDSLGLLIPCAIILGVTLTHTIVLIRDTAIDPTTHNLLPFEYIFVWIMVGVPAIAGSMLARGICWTIRRLMPQ